MKTVPPDCFVAIFHSLHRVMGAERTLRERRTIHRLMPTPRPLTSTCGLSIVFPAALVEEVESTLTGELAIVELWRACGHDYQRVARP